LKRGKTEKTASITSPEDPGQTGQVKDGEEGKPRHILKEHGAVVETEKRGIPPSVRLLGQGKKDQFYRDPTDPGGEQAEFVVERRLENCRKPRGGGGGFCWLVVFCLLGVCGGWGLLMFGVFVFFWGVLGVFGCVGFCLMLWLVCGGGFFCFLVCFLLFGGVWVGGWLVFVFLCVFGVFVVSFPWWGVGVCKWVVVFWGCGFF